MNFSLSPRLKIQLKKIKQKDSKLLKKIQKQLKLFQENHKHPSLRTHKLKGSLQEKWSISIEGNIRMLFYFRQEKRLDLYLKEEEAVFYTIGAHDEVYK